MGGADCGMGGSDLLALSADGVKGRAGGGSRSEVEGCKPTTGVAKEDAEGIAIFRWAGIRCNDI